LADGLWKAFAIQSGQDDALCKHVDDNGKEEPPHIFFVTVVEDAEFQPDSLVFIESRGVTIGLLQLSCGLENHEDKVCEHGSKQAQGDTG
jgi:hypothetical protein